MAPKDTNKTDWAALIAAVAGRRDRTAFTVLFEHFAPRIKAFMQRGGTSASQAEELAQETMLAVWRKAEKFDPASTGAAAWIFTIARNMRIDAFRRSRGDVAGPWDVEAEFFIDESALPDDQFAAVQQDGRVRGALTQLTPEQMRVVELSFFEERPHIEIAKILDVPLGTVKSRLRLAMKRLRGALGDLK